MNWMCTNSTEEFLKNRVLNQKKQEITFKEIASMHTKQYTFYKNSHKPKYVHHVVQNSCLKEERGWE